MGRAVANEFAKMRRLRVVPVAVAMVLGVVALSCQGLTGPDFAERPWRSLLASMSLAVSLLSPVLLAVLASRPVDVEHRGNGWLLSRTSGLSPGELCRAKCAATGAVVVGATLLQSGLVYVLGRLAGATAAFPLGQWLGYTAAIVLINLVLFALHLLLAAHLGNQLVGLGLGVLGVFLTVSGSALPAWLAHFLPPWGYYALVSPVEYRGDDIVRLSPSYPSVLALGIAGGAAFLLLTRLLDRQEA